MDNSCLIVNMKTNCYWCYNEKTFDKENIQLESNYLKFQLCLINSETQEIVATYPQELPYLIIPYSFIKKWCSLSNKLFKCQIEVDSVNLLPINDNDEITDDIEFIDIPNIEFESKYSFNELIKTFGLEQYQKSPIVNMTIHLLMNNSPLIVIKQLIEIIDNQQLEISKVSNNTIITYLLKEIFVTSINKLNSSPNKKELFSILSELMLLQQRGLTIINQLTNETNKKN